MSAGITSSWYTGEALQNLCPNAKFYVEQYNDCLLYTSPSPRDLSTSRMPSSA